MTSPAANSSRSLASASALPLLSACGRGSTSTAQNGDALNLLSSVADNFLALYTETATSLGVDIGAGLVPPSFVASAGELPF